MESGNTPPSQDPTTSSFQPEGYYGGIPYRFEAGGAIDALIGGKVVRFSDFSAFVRPLQEPASVGRHQLAALLIVHVLVSCASFYFVQYYYSYLPFIAESDPASLKKAIVYSLPMLGLMSLFVLGRFSFGYCVSFYFFTILLSYCWLAPSSVFDYDTRLMTLSILACAIAFSVPSILWTPALPKLPEIAPSQFEAFLKAILIISAAVLATAATYHFRLALPGDIYLYREQVEFPKLLAYAVGIMTGALLPFAFACFAFLKRWTYVIAVAALMLAAYPVTLTKLNLLTPAWLAFLLMLPSRAGARGVVILSLLVPMSAGLLTIAPLKQHWILSSPLFSTINFRMIAVPAFALDIYSEFFSHNPLTYFCQISFLKPFMTNCPYAEPLGVVMDRFIGFGGLNASLFATEGIASVGPLLAPLSALVCGFIVALGNGISAKLPPRFILVSSGVALQAFLNVPMTTLLLTNGVAVLFLLWLLTPAALFAAKPSER